LSIRLIVEPSVAPLVGRCVYVQSDHSLDFVLDDARDRGAIDRTSLTLGMLQLEVDIQTRLLMYVWGYHPRAAWKEGVVNAPRAVPGGVRIDPSVHLAPGVSQAVGDEQSWFSTYDAKNGWLFIDRHSNEAPDAVVEFARGILIGLASSRCVALWLHPSMSE